MTSREDVQSRIALLRQWLARRLAPDAMTWVDAQAARIAADPAGRALIPALGLASRRVGKSLLNLDADEAAAAEQLRPGLDTGDWTLDQVSRILLLLSSYVGGEDTFPARLDSIVRSGAIGEQIALYRGLPLYPLAHRVLPTASEGIRSAMQPIYEAVAHRSPYPGEHFSEAMWNQMVVKALFIGSRLAPIQMLDARRNADLARMLVDYAHERRAAGRAVSPELWRCVGPFGEYFTELARVFRSASGDESRAAAMALAECPVPEALTVLESAPTLWSDIRHGRMTWDTLA